MRQIQTTAKYLQGQDLFLNLAWIFNNGAKRKVFFLAGRTALKHFKDVITSNFNEHHLPPPAFEAFKGECSYEEVDRVSALVNAGNFDVVVGFGGGKAMDTAKFVASRLKKYCVMAPTIVCSDAPCTSVSVMYSKEGDKVVGIEVHEKNPDLIIVDTQVVANAPIKFLLAGIGDALSTYFDVRICHRHNFKNTFGQEIATSVLHLAKASYEMILKDGLEAKLSCELKLVSEALENVVEAATYLSGVGCENGGISISHSIQDALTELPECHKFLHGYKVGFATLCVLVADEAPELNEFMSIAKKLGLPLTLEQLDITSNKEEKIKGIMDIAFPIGPKANYPMPLRLTKDKLYASILLADGIGREYLAT